MRWLMHPERADIAAIVAMLAIAGLMAAFA
jgi:hypothetical protein